MESSQMEAEGSHEIHIPITVYQQDEENAVCPLRGQSETSGENQIIFITPDSPQSGELMEGSSRQENTTDQIYAYLTDDGQGNFTLVNEHSYNKVLGNSSGESDSILSSNTCPVYFISGDEQAAPLKGREPMMQSIGGCSVSDEQNLVVVEVQTQEGKNEIKCLSSNMDQSSHVTRKFDDGKSELTSFSTTVSECLKRKQNSKTPKKIVRLCNLSKQTAPKTVMTTHTEPALEVETRSDDSHSQYSLSGLTNSCLNDTLDSSGYASQSFLDYQVVHSGRQISLHRRPSTSLSSNALSETHPLSDIDLKVEPMETSDIPKISSPCVKLVLSHPMGHITMRDEALLPNLNFSSAQGKAHLSRRSAGPLYTSTPEVPDRQTPNRTPSGTKLKKHSSIHSLLTTPKSFKVASSSKDQHPFGNERLVGEPAVARRIIPSATLSSTIQTETQSVVETAGNPQEVLEQQVPGATPRSRFDPGPTDDSLTNIQWLGKMSGQNLSLKDAVKARNNSALAKNPSTITQIIATEQQIAKVGRECGVKKRPPYSYMHLIQMAISSRHDKRMTLREIYQWIEDKFPYYKYSSKQGWKNSIRHNLSLYDIFVREKPHIGGKSGSSYWTLRNDLKNKNSKAVRYATLDPGREKRDHGTAYVQLIGGGPGSTSQVIQVASSSSTSSSSSAGRDPSQQTVIKPKKGPTPLLPKLPPIAPPHLQAYALIPIPTGMPVVAPPQMVVSPWPAPHPHSSSNTIQTINTSNSSFISLNSSTGSNNSSITLKRSYFQEKDPEPPHKKHVKIAPKASILDKSSSRRKRSNCLLSSSVDTSELQKKLLQMKFDSGIGSDASSCGSPGPSDLSSSKSNPEPPKPSRHKRSRKDKPVLLRDCDEEDSLMALRGSKENTKENEPPLVEDPNKSLGDVLAFKLPETDPVMHISLNESALSESGFHELLLATLEHDMPSPAEGLMSTPPKPLDHSRSPHRASTGTPLSPLISPIKNVAALTDEARPLDGFFTPNSKLATSTPNGGKSKSRGPRSSSGLNVKSPRIGSLRDLGLPGLTPLKTAQRSPTAQSMDEGSPNTSLISNRSFQKLLGDFHLDSMMDQVDDSLDIANFNLFQC